MRRGCNIRKRGRNIRRGCNITGRSRNIRSRGGNKEEVVTQHGEVVIKRF